MNKRNSVSSILLGIGLLQMLICLIVGFISLPSSIVWWIGGFILGMMFIGFAEVIHLLQKIADRLDTNNNNHDSSKRIPHHEYEYLYEQMRLMNPGPIVDGILTLSRERLVYYNTDMINHLEIPIKDIVQCSLNNETPIHTHVVVQYNDPSGHLNSIQLFNCIDPDTYGYEIYTKITMYKEES
ncbi:MAG: hypothetical protein ACE3L7_14325 [Candidatus Pristimantibacillus sp.]